jgi:hypothetical protein
MWNATGLLTNVVNLTERAANSRPYARLQAANNPAYQVASIKLKYETHNGVYDDVQRGDSALRPCFP